MINSQNHRFGVQIAALAKGAADAKPSNQMKHREEIDAYAIIPPWGWDDDFKAHESLAKDPEGAWERFCRPALRKEGFEEDGFEAVPVTMMIELK